MVSPRTLARAVEGLQDTSRWGREVPPAPRPGVLAAHGLLSHPGARTSRSSWRRKEPGPPSTEPLVIWVGSGVDLTSCLNLALCRIFNRGYDPLSSLSQAYPYIFL